MRIRLIYISKPAVAPVQELCTDYQGRLGHYIRFESEEIPPSDKADERMLKAIRPQDFVVLLDEKGKALSSKGLASFIEQRMQQSVDLTLLIGGAYGFSEAVRKRANSSVRLSDMTMPHQLARLVLLEQLYRAFTIIRNEKYHHA